MALTFTKPITLGFRAPDFSLPDTISGKTLSFNDIKGEKGTLIIFICNHCPYVQHVIHELVNIGNEYRNKGIGMAVINPNDVEAYPEDRPEKMKEWAEELKFPFPYLYDESQETAKAYEAACTPDFDLFDQDDKCIYRGQLDGARPGNDIPVTGKDLREALNLLLDGKEENKNQIPSAGCGIKWKE
ncbi:MAG: thioredoxin family protein [Bacteroidales bacterium]|nr:thioredoxin family protein [Bacteroidales bacterium]